MTLKERLADQIRKNKEFSASAIHTRITQGMIGILEEFAPPTASEIGLDREAFAKRLTRLTVAKSPFVNAFAISEDNFNTFEIRLNIGLLMYFFQIGHLFAAKIIFMDSESGESIGFAERPTYDFLADAFQRLAQSYVQGTIGAPILDPRTFRESQIWLAVSLTRQAESFIVAHELGHIVIRHRKSPSTELEHALKVARAVFKSSHPQMSDSEVVLAVPSDWAGEFAADLVGLKLFLNRPEFKHYFDNWGPGDAIVPNLLAGIQFSFAATDLLEAYFSRCLQRDRAASTHPPSALRDLVLCMTLIETYKLPPDAQVLGYPVATIADEILSRLR